MEEPKARFLPFHAINEFMRDDFRMTVVREVLHAMPNLPEETRLVLEQITRKVVKVPGFRNSAKAPVALRLRSTADAFTKSSPLVAVILSGWGDLHAPLRQMVYDLLQGRGWGAFPPEADRTQMPGFMITWPKGEDFDVLNTAFKEKFPEDKNTTDDISLMVVWVSLRLPYELEDEEEAAPTGLAAGLAAALDADDELPAGAPA